MATSSNFQRIALGTETSENILAKAATHASADVSAMQSWDELSRLVNGAVANVSGFVLNRPYSSALRNGPRDRHYAVAKVLSERLTELRAWMAKYPQWRALRTTVTITEVMASRTTKPSWNPDGSVRTVSTWPGWQPSFTVTALNGSQLTAFLLDYQGDLDQVEGMYASALMTALPLIANTSPAYRWAVEKRLEEQRIAAEKRRRTEYIFELAAAAWPAGWQREEGGALIQQHVFRLGTGGTSFENDYKPLVDAGLAWAKIGMANIAMNLEDYCRIANSCPSPGPLATQWVRIGFSDVGDDAYRSMRLQIAQYFERRADQQNWSQADIAAAIRDTGVRAVVVRAVTENIRVTAAAIRASEEAQRAKVAAEQAAMIEQQRALEAARFEEARRAAEAAALTETARLADEAKIEAAAEARRASELAAARQRRVEIEIDAALEEERELRAATTRGTTFVIDATPEPTTPVINIPTTSTDGPEVVDDVNILDRPPAPRDFVLPTSEVVIIVDPRGPDEDEAPVTPIPIITDMPDDGPIIADPPDPDPLVIEEVDSAQEAQTAQPITAGFGAGKVIGSLFVIGAAVFAIKKAS